MLLPPAQRRRHRLDRSLSQPRRRVVLVGSIAPLIVPQKWRPHAKPLPVHRPVSSVATAHYAQAERSMHPGLSEAGMVQPRAPSFPQAISARVSEAVAYPPLTVIFLPHVLPTLYAASSHPPFLPPPPSPPP